MASPTITTPHEVVNLPPEVLSLLDANRTNVALRFPFETVYSAKLMHIADILKEDPQVEQREAFGKITDARESSGKVFSTSFVACSASLFLLTWRMTRERWFGITHRPHVVKNIFNYILLPYFLARTVERWSPSYKRYVREMRGLNLEPNREFLKKRYQDYQRYLGINPDADLNSSKVSPRNPYQQRLLPQNAPYAQPYPQQYNPPQNGGSQSSSSGRY